MVSFTFNKISSICINSLPKARSAPPSHYNYVSNQLESVVWMLQGKNHCRSRIIFCHNFSIEKNEFSQVTRRVFLISIYPKNTERVIF